MRWFLAVSSGFARVTGVERHSACTRPVTGCEDELWMIPFAVIRRARRQHDDALGHFALVAGPGVVGGKPTRTAGARAPRSGSGAAALTASRSRWARRCDDGVVRRPPLGVHRQRRLRVCEMSVGQQSWVVVDGVLRGPLTV